MTGMRETGIEHINTTTMGRALASTITAIMAARAAAVGIGSITTDVTTDITTTDVMTAADGRGAAIARPQAARAHQSIKAEKAGKKAAPIGEG